MRSEEIETSRNRLAEHSTRAHHFGKLKVAMKNRKLIRKVLSIFLTVTLVLPATALAGFDGNGKKNFKEGVKYAANQQWDLAAQEFALAVAAAPDNAEYRAHYMRSLMQASIMYVKRGDTLAEQNDYASAYNQYRLGYNYDPSNELAKVKMQRMLDVQKAQSNGTEQVKYNPHTGNIVPTSSDVRIATKPRVGEVQKKIEIKDLGVKASIASLSRNLGLNVIFDETVANDKRFSIELQDITFARATDLIMLQNKLAFEMVDRKTLFVYADNPTNRQRFERLMVKTFYVNNAKLSEVRAAIQGLMTGVGGGRNVLPIEGANALMVRGTAGELQMVKEVLDTFDKNTAEVVIDISIYEISRTDALALGNQIALQSQPVSETRFDASGQPVQVTTGNSASLSNLGGLGVLGIANLAGTTFSPFLGGIGTLFGMPPTGVSLLQAQGRTRLLYNSQVHALDNQQNKTKLGRSVPVKTGTNYGYGSTVVPTAGQQPGQTTQPGSSYNSGLFDNIQYKDVGLVIDVTPKITNEGYVEIKMNLETSNVEDSGETTNLNPTFTQRTLSTTSRVLDGVTSVVGGVRQDNKSDVRASIPVIGMLPILGRFFSTPRQSSSDTDLIITVTPHIIRAPRITDEDHLAQYSGQMQGGISRSLEEVLQQIQADDEQEKRMIAQRGGAGQTARDSQAVQTAQATLSTPPAPTTGAATNSSGQFTIPANVAVNNVSQGGTATQSGAQTSAQQVAVNQPQLQPVSAPAAQVPIQDANLNQPRAVDTVPPSIQPGSQPTREKQSPDMPPATAATAAGAADKPAVEGKPKEETFDPKDFESKPETPVSPARVSAPQVPDHVRKLIEERTKQSAREFEDQNKKANETPQIPDDLKDLRVVKGQTIGGKTPQPSGPAVQGPVPIELKITPQQESARIDQPIQVAVSAKGRGSLKGGVINLAFDTSRFRIASVRPGTLLGAKGSVIHQVSNNVVRITMSDVPAKALSEEGSLFIVELMPISAGDSTITFSQADSKFDLADGSTAKFVSSPLRLPVVK